MRRHHPALRPLTVSLVCLPIVWAAAARAVVLTPDQGSGEQVPAGQRPPDGVVARWSGSATAVAIAPNYVITTNHQGGGVGTSVYIHGVRYTVSAWFRDGTSDFKVAHITRDGVPAGLTDYVDIYPSLNEVGKTALLGGYGDSRGAILTSGGQPYAYKWDGAVGNTVLRWGRNVIDGSGVGYGGGWTSQVLKTDFDDVGTGGYVSWEAATADHDSGSGWFINSAGKWYLAALTRSTEHIGSTWFANYGNPANPDPEQMDAVRLAWYKDWINYILHDIQPGDANLDGTVGIADLATLANNYGKPSGANWNEGDFNHDNAVGIADLVVLADNYGANGSPVPAPEPTTAVLLAPAAVALLRRRRNTR
ncbi:MAG TPA: hypothetical protein VFJ30_00475 [Phycisphaerae bacterium]|nr:hypothetical protein [Phycisphaerae bacterium]